MTSKSMNRIMENIYDLLKEGELSIRQLSIKVESQWITIEKALETMKKMGVVSERFGDETKRKERLFRLKD